MTNFKQLQEKYENDAEFHNLVIHLVKMIKDCQMTPSEIKEASIFACILFELENYREC